MLVISGLAIYYGLQNEIPLYILLLATVLAIFVVNLVVFLSEKVLEKIIDYFYKKYEKRKMKNYSLFDWMGESNWIKLYDNLSVIQQIDKNSIYDNFENIKLELKKEFNSLDKLETLRVYLEVQVESPKLITLNSATQTVLLALITSSLVSYINKINSGGVNVILYILIVIIVWFLLLGAISYISKQIDKFKFLLKVVLECIKEEKEKEEKRNLINRREISIHRKRAR